MLGVGTLAFIGCDFGQNNDENPLNLLEVGVLRIATDADFAPFEYVTESGDVEGISITIAREVATMLGLRLEISLMTWSAVLLAAQTGVADMAVAGMTILDERRQAMDFTIPWFLAGQVVVTTASNNEFDGKTAAQIRTAMSGRNVGGVLGQTGARLGREVGAIVQDFDTNALMLLAVQNGTIPFAIMDNVVALRAVAENNNLRVINVPLTNEQYGFGVRRGNAELLYQVNNAMATMFHNGRLAEIFAYYGL
jgi:polar amino acid transport system substrate-binding protein